MNSLSRALILGICILLPNLAVGSGRIEWRYEGHLGPENWGFIKTDYALCGNGQQQSPVDLADAVETTLAPLELHWRTADWELYNSGTALELEAQDAGYAMIDGDRFELRHISFHAPSEHAINGVRFPMEMQYLHQNEAGDVSVISVMLKGGGRNDAFDAIMARAPVAANHRNAVGRVSTLPLVSDIGDVLRYHGSMTTPPCTEGVQWTILTDPVVVSDAALMAFQAIYPMNARPLQPLNRRYILTD